jgi:LSD1 subclass zinc finger protein
MELPWLVLLCQSCDRAFGKPRGSKDLRCPHCNHADSKVLSRHMSASEASNAVSVANVPPEIRNQLSSWLDEQEHMAPKSNTGSIDGRSILSEAVDENGLVTIDSLQIVLKKANLAIDAEAFAERACAEGELLQDGPNRWKCA